MQLSLRNFGALVALESAAVQSGSSVPLDLSPGSPLRALIEADASVAIFLEWLIVQAMLATRLSTSGGTDVDTFVGDYGLVRDAAVAAAVPVVLSRFTPQGSATVLVGSAVRTGDATQDFMITADATNPAYSPAAGSGGGYILVDGVASVTVPAVAAVPCRAGNVSAGAISLAGTTLTGIDIITNLVPATGGADAESDAALKARFSKYIVGLSKATAQAIGAAILGVRQGLTYSLAVNVDEQGQTERGHFVVTVDDGSGTPPPALLAQVYAAVDGVRALTETFSVQPPQVVRVNVALTMTVGQGSGNPQISANKQALLAPVQAAIAGYVNGLGVGNALSLTRISALAYAVSPAIANVSGVTINGLAQDLVVAANQTIKVQTILVS